MHKANKHVMLVFKLIKNQMNCSEVIKTKIKNALLYFSIRVTALL